MANDDPGMGALHHLPGPGLTRSEWALRHLHLSVSEGTSDAPGLLLIQIDGLARAEMERAVSAGRMPFLGSLLNRPDYGLRDFYPGLPSTTPAVQAELFFGVKAGVPAFSFFHRGRGEVVTMFDPDLVREFETAFEARGRGLLGGGSSWSNIYSGGAAPNESHFCLSSLGLGDLFGRSHPGTRVILLLLHLPAVLRAMALVLLELGLGLGDALLGILRGQSIPLEFGALLSRMGVGVAMREWLRVGGKIDLARGLPIVHVNFLGYDEMSHRRGPGSAFAHWSLRGIDAAIADMVRAARRSSRRRYDVIVFSDHGQDRTDSFETSQSGGTEAMVAACLARPVPESRGQRGFPRSRPLSRRLYERSRRRFPVRPIGPHDFSLAAMGPVAHVSIHFPVTDKEKQTFARSLVEQGNVPVVLFVEADGSVVWNDALGTARSASEWETRWHGLSDDLRRERSTDLRRLCRHEHAGDLILLGFSGSGMPRTFANERGSHGGFGPQESRGFVFLPQTVPLPSGTPDFVRPCVLREALLAFLSGASRADDARSAPEPTCSQSTSPVETPAVRHSHFGSSK